MQRYGILASMVGVMAVIALADGLFEDDFRWPVAGQNLSNTRSAPHESQISPTNAASLAVKWTLATGGDVSATPTVAGNTIFVPDWAGNVYAVEGTTGNVIWSVQVPQLDGVVGAVSRVSPAVHGDDVIIGDIENDGATALHAGANLMALNRQTGKLHWMTQVDSQGMAIITGSPVVYGNVVYVGISSNEEILAIPNTYACCVFRGSVVALDANTGQILWKTYTAPDNGGKPGGYSGNPVWQPPAIDPERGLLYVGTGNNYSVPASVTACIDANPTADCTAPDDYFDTAMALDLRDGHIRWAKKVGTYDAWTVACFISPPGTNCPAPPGPDFDLSGSGPNLLDGLVVFGQKSGFLWAFDPQDGTLRWSTPVGPGGIFGGIEWGTATDGKRIYVAISNSGHVKTTLLNGQAVTGGFWNAVDAATGKILWQTADPDGAFDYGSVSEANGVVYGGSLSGKMFALVAQTGAILWQFTTAGSVIDGPSVVNGTLYWGSGYGRVGGTANNKLYAFSLPQSE